MNKLTCIACGKPMIQGNAQIAKVFGKAIESAHLYCEDKATAITKKEIGSNSPSQKWLGLFFI